MFSPRATAVIQALIVTVIWSASWVLIKIVLQGGVSPLVFAGLRYFVAFLALLIICLTNPTTRRELRALTRRDWRLLATLGVLWYALVPGFQFIALDILPSATLGLILNMTPLLVALGGALLLKEFLTRRQVAGISLFITGLIFYFLASAGLSAQVAGLMAAVACLIANAFATITARFINRGGGLGLHPLTVTTGSTGIGAVLLLGTGLIIEGVPSFGLTEAGIIVWLGVIHTAFAYTLWNSSLRHLTAVESSLINGLVLVQITILAWIFLNESVSPIQIVGLGIALLGVVIVQVQRLPAPLMAILRRTPVDPTPSIAP